MSIKTRFELNELFQQMQERSKKIEEQHGTLPLAVGLSSFAKALKDEAEGGAPSVRLRQIGQLTKHYLEELQSKAGRADPVQVIIRYNVAMPLLLGGHDVQQSIKKARAALMGANREIKQHGYISSPEEIERQRERRRQMARDEKTDRAVAEATNQLELVCD